MKEGPGNRDDLKGLTSVTGTPEEKKQGTGQKNLKGQEQWLNPIISALWEAKVGRLLELRSLIPAWPTRRNPVSTKNTEISRVWWCTPVPSYSGG